MFSIQNWPDYILPFIPLFGTVCFVLFALSIAHIFIIKRHRHLGNEKLFSRHLLMMALTLCGFLLVILALPVTDAYRNQIITLVGLVISGIFAFSSGTIFANLMAGLMLRVTRPFSTGDFIQVEDFFGRVVERGLLDIEIQTEHRELISFPNTYMISNPISVTRSTGAIVSTTVSLGYDVHHAIVSQHLLEAAIEAKLDEPFVQILNLGDFSITYKISGVLEDVKSLLTARSHLSRCILDSLHRQGIEIASPNIMNQRQLKEASKIIPKKYRQSDHDSLSIPEDVVFDIASKAEQLEKEKQMLLDEMQLLKQELKQAAGETKKSLQDQVNLTSEKLKELESPENEPPPENELASENKLPPEEK